MPNGGILVRGLVALVLLVGCTACSSLLSDSRDDEISALLVARARAVLGGDRAAFVHLLDARDPGFVSTEMRMFDNLQDLPVEGLGYRLKSTFHDQTGGRDIWNVEGREDLRLEGFDTETSSSRIAFTVTEVDGRFVFTPPAQDAAYDDRSQPWDLTRIQADRTEHALLVYEEDTAPLVGGGAVEVERAIAQVDRAFPLQWDERVVIYLLDDPEVLEPLGPVASLDEPGGFAGATIPVLSDDVEPEVVGTRVVLSPAAYDVDRTARGQLLRHEITHEAMGFGIGDTRGSPRGVATYVEYRSLPRRRWPVAASDIARARQRYDATSPRHTGWTIAPSTTPS